MYASTVAHACLARLSSYLLSESRRVMGFQVYLKFFLRNYYNWPLVIPETERNTD